MPKYIEMPKLSDTMTEGTLVKWRKKAGDKVVTGGRRTCSVSSTRVSCVMETRLVQAPADSAC